MPADVLEGAGFDVRFLGAGVPESSLLAWVSEHRPAAVALGVTMPSAAPALTRELPALREYDSRLPLIIGGQGVPAALRESPAVFYAADTESLARFVDRNLKAWQPVSCLTASLSATSAVSRLSVMTRTRTRIWQRAWRRPPLRPPTRLAGRRGALSP
jgi:hypothetical protein